MAHISNYKSPFIYFGRKGYLAEVSGADQTVAGGVALVATGVAYDHATLAGFVPEDHTVGAAATASTSTSGYRIVIKAKSDNSAVDRGTNLIAQNDFITGAAFVGNGGVVGKPLTNETVELLAGSFGVSSGVITVADYADTTDGNFGYDIQNNDLLWVEQTAQLATASNTPAPGAITTGYCAPMKNFIGADTIAYAHEHYNGTALDRTILSFRSTVGTNTDDTVVLTHTAGKYKAIMEALEEIANSNNYTEAHTFFDFDADGVETHYRNSLGIVGCFIDSAAK